MKTKKQRMAENYWSYNYEKYLLAKSMNGFDLSGSNELTPLTQAQILTEVRKKMSAKKNANKKIIVVEHDFF